MEEKPVISNEKLSMYNRKTLLCSKTVDISNVTIHIFESSDASILLSNKEK